MPDINLSYAYTIEQCNDDSVGYSQDYRNRRTVDGITYFDCSSLIYYALCEGGFDLDPDEWPFTTSTMCNILLSLGFVEVNITAEWLPGDILWRSGHTEMVYDGRITMGAHSSSYELSKQVSINTYQSSPSDWTRCFRYSSGASVGTSWIKGNRYLSKNEMRNNAEIIFNYLQPRGWSTNAIAGMLGNMQAESTINPGIWQSLNEGNYSGGFGLVQWTPATNYINWADENEWEIDDGFGQLYWIDNLSDVKGQWIETDDYPLSWDEFKSSNESAEYLAAAFLKNFERAGVEVEALRKLYATQWYSFLKTSVKIVSKKRKGFKFFLYARKRRFIR